MNLSVNRLLDDFKETISRYELWQYTAQMDVVKKYRRSKLGPFWISLNLIMFVSTIGIMWSYLWNIDVKNFLPYFCVSYLAWEFISSVLNSAPTLFSTQTSVLQNMKLPMFYYVFRFVYYHCIIFGHHIVVFFICLIFILEFKMAMILMLIPALILYVVNAISLSVIVGIICTKYRDMENIVPQLTRIIFFVTPILWQLDDGRAGASLVKYNFVYHFLEIFRRPLLGGTPTMYNYVICGAMTIIFVIIAIILLRRNYDKIVFWL